MNLIFRALSIPVFRSPRPRHAAQGLRGLLLVACLTSAASTQVQLTNYALQGDFTGFGRSLGTGGDLDNDGRDDYVLAAPDYSGSRGLIQAANLEDELWSRVGAQGTDQLGAGVAICGDINGDGHDDVIAGAPGVDEFGVNAGAAYVYSGPDGALLMTLKNGAGGSGFGASVDGGPDVDHDGVPDLLVGAPYLDFLGNQHVGGVYVFSGASGTLIGVRFGIEPSARLGTCVAWAGDVNDDGTPDYMAGAPTFDTPLLNCGRIEVYSGVDNQWLFVRNGTQAGENLGLSVDGAGDFDNDGIDDVIVGGHGYDGDRGSARILHGPNGTLGVSWLGNLPGDRLGWAVAGVGDIDKDGWDDVMYGVPQPSAGYGYAAVRSGRTWLQMWKQIDGTISTGGPPEISDRFGEALGGIGDADGDGWLDVIVGAPGADVLTFTDGGRVYVDSMIHEQQVLFGYQNPGPGDANMRMYGSPLYSQGQADLVIQNMTLFRPVFLIVSAVQLDAPFKGGILAPDPAFGLIIALNSGIFGTIKFPGVAGGGGPFTAYMQAMVDDPGQPSGWDLTNPVVVEFLP